MSAKLTAWLVVNGDRTVEHPMKVLDTAGTLADVENNRERRELTIIPVDNSDVLSSGYGDC